MPQAEIVRSVVEKNRRLIAPYAKLIAYMPQEIVQKALGEMRSQLVAHFETSPDPDGVRAEALTNACADALVAEIVRLAALIEGRGTTGSA